MPQKSLLGACYSIYIQRHNWLRFKSNMLWQKFVVDDGRRKLLRYLLVFHNHIQSWLKMNQIILRRRFQLRIYGAVLHERGFIESCVNLSPLIWIWKKCTIRKTENPRMIIFQRIIIIDIITAIMFPKQIIEWIQLRRMIVRSRNIFIHWIANCNVIVRDISCITRRIFISI